MDSSFSIVILLAYWMASSAVAPWQPPSPPQWFGLGVHERSCCTEKLRSCCRFSSLCARSMVAVAKAQQLPHSPWSRTLDIAFDLPTQLQSLGAFEMSTTRVSLLRKDAS